MADLPILVWRAMVKDMSFESLKALRSTSVSAKSEADGELVKRYKLLTLKHPKTMTQVMSYLNKIPYPDYEFKLVKAYNSRTLFKYFGDSKNVQDFANLIRLQTNETVFPWLKNTLSPVIATPFHEAETARCLDIINSLDFRNAPVLEFAIALALVFECHLTEDTLDVFSRRVNDMLYMDSYDSDYLIHIDEKLAVMRDDFV